MSIDGAVRGPLGVFSAIALAGVMVSAGGPGPLVAGLLGTTGTQGHLVDAAAPVVPWMGGASGDGVDVEFSACGNSFDHADVRETATTVTITVHLHGPGPAPATLPTGQHSSGFAPVMQGCNLEDLTHAVVRLHVPLGTRRLLDRFYVPALPPSVDHLGTFQ